MVFLQAVCMMSQICSSKHSDISEAAGTWAEGDCRDPYPILQLEWFYTLITRSQVLGITFPYNSWQAGLLVAGACYHLQRYGAYWRTEWWKDTPCCLKTFLSRPKSAWKQTPRVSLPLSNPVTLTFLSFLMCKMGKPIVSSSYIHWFMRINPLISVGKLWHWTCFLSLL